MKRVVGVVAGMAALVALVANGEQPAMAGNAAGSSAVGAAHAAAPAAPVVWGTCPRVTGKAVNAALECATVEVPLDYSRPSGQSIKVAINRIRAKTPRNADRLGTLLINPGGPGASGRALTEYVASGLPAGVSERYDVVGFDPRGVGASEPALSCVDPEVFYRAPRQDAVPHSVADEQRLLARAATYAGRCGERWSWLLPHLSTENAARDMDRIRAALGEERISYLGFSYGTYLGAVYATLFPKRVKRLVLDSIVDPTAVWYRSNLTQDHSFERRHHQFLTWIAGHHDVYKLGRTFRQTQFAYYAMRDRLRTRPAGGVMGPSELDDAFIITGYSDRVWPQFAQAWSDYVRQGETKGLLDLYEKHGKNDASDENGYAVYLGVQCRDARWPREWSTWRGDMYAAHRTAPFLTWPNTWFNAPCAFWPVPGGPPVEVRGSAKLPPVLMLQARDDAATPYAGALRMRRLFPTARLVMDKGGNHGVSLAGNQCVDRHLAAYLLDGTLPRRDAVCEALPQPSPAERMAARRVPAAAGPGVGELLGVLGLLRLPHLN
ncbi:Tripeptidyl aminopeptidase precursor [Nonomuraea coxensis DSM 45129]|uniref:Tripeptidyl aminopeptidase n=1 Tax=Nonomuraea coxensis DSM 45129 TaxID=1122611 RepID=A0ABX8TVX8_9ACTN|nr:alpha/beta hydrolase [Nonomuraea coxensis]QYC39499.1 Tripeptidyl aminopeptidase precursor [Nonomuraea coxensis DSM 45129]